jgi:hypothetical protein
VAGGLIPSEMIDFLKARMLCDEEIDKTLRSSTTTSLDECTLSNERFVLAPQHLSEKQSLTH